ncbi:hypothetical protein ACJX0J_029640 [Zea mays]
MHKLLQAALHGLEYINIGWCFITGINVTSFFVRITCNNKGHFYLVLYKNKYMAISDVQWRRKKQIMNGEDKIEEAMIMFYVTLDCVSVFISVEEELKIMLCYAMFYG